MKKGGTLVQAADLKYYQDIAPLHNCPPAGADCRACEAFRFVFGEIDDRRNFIPPAKRDLSRVFENDRRTCDAHALSFFVSRETAIAFYRKKSFTYKGFQKTIGTHIASGTIDVTDGLCTVPCRSGHFNLFQAAAATDLKDRFQIVEPLQ